VLDQSGQRFRIALGKAPSRRKSTPPPCIFLLRTRTGHHRCGLGDLRPMVCRAFASDLEDGVLSLANDGRCTCHTWTLSDVDIEEETALVQARQRDAEEYCAVVARWNAGVQAAAGASFGFDDYCRHVLAAYDWLGAGGA
jgi:Fe-S-cluster containining protein